MKTEKSSITQTTIGILIAVIFAVTEVNVNTKWFYFHKCSIYDTFDPPQKYGVILEFPGRKKE